MTQELFERAWLNCLEAERYDSNDLLDIFSSIEEGLGFRPQALGQPHPALNEKGLWVYVSPPIARLPKVYVLYEIVYETKTVHLWAARFP